jgi:glycosyltransferase involved in cell wall biosynthesis
MRDFRKLRLVHVTEGRSRINSLNGVDISLYYFGITDKPPVGIPGVDTVSAKKALIPVMGTGELREKICEFEPDYVHFHGAYVPGNSAGARIARRNNIPYVVTPHGNANQDVLNRRAWLKKPYRKFWELTMLEGARFVHAIADREDIRQYGVASPIEEARNGVDLPLMFRRTMRRDGVVRYGVDREKKVLLFLGRLDREQKALDVVVAAFAEALRGNPELHLILAGGDWKDDRRIIGEQISSLGINDQVTFTGAVYGEDKAGLLRDCDVFVHPSRWEAGVPFSVLEALSYGKPVVVTKEVDRENILAGNEAVYLAKGEVESVATGMISLLNCRESVAEGARGLCEEHFSWRASAQLLTQAYWKHLE